MDRPSEEIPDHDALDLLVAPITIDKFKKELGEAAGPQVPAVRQLSAPGEQVPGDLRHGVLKMFLAETPSTHLGRIGNRNGNTAACQKRICHAAPPAPARNSVALSSFTVGTTASNSVISSAPIGGSG